MAMLDGTHSHACASLDRGDRHVSLPCARENDQMSISTKLPIFFYSNLTTYAYLLDVPWARSFLYLAVNPCIP